jgi:hypothetical protein
MLGETITEKLAWNGIAVGDRGKAAGRFKIDLGRDALEEANAARAGETIPLLKMDWDILPEDKR